MKKSREVGYKLYLGLVYLLIVIPVMLLGIVLAGWFVSRMNRKHTMGYIKRVEAYQSRYKEHKMKLVNKLNKLETKLSKTPEWKLRSINKVNKKIELIKKKIDNINLILDDTSKQLQEQVEQKEQGKLMTKLDEKFNELKENIL